MKRKVNGILILDKPEGLTSNAALQVIKRLYGAEKAGHSGSLDPKASGLLPICLGEATKFSQFLLEADKEYQIVAKLGERTDSGDTEGSIIKTSPVPMMSLDFLESMLDKFRGPLLQVPSMFSALKMNGQPLYKLARQGIEVERAARSITIYSLKLLSYQEDILKLEVKASKGTYIRTLVDDIGEALGCGAHVTALRRTQSGPYREAQMISLDALKALENQYDNLDKYLLPLDSAVSWPAVHLSEAAAFYLKQGQPVIVPYAPKEGSVKLLMKDGRFLGIGEIIQDGRVAPRRLIATHSNVHAHIHANA